MKKVKATKSISKAKQNEELLKILANFFRESTAIMKTARKEARQKYPDLFKTP